MGVVWASRILETVMAYSRCDRSLRGIFRGTGGGGGEHVPS